jgi:hypothetical protein
MKICSCCGHKHCNSELRCGTCAAAGMRPSLFRQKNRRNVYDRGLWREVIKADIREAMWDMSVPELMSDREQR